MTIENKEKETQLSKQVEETNRNHPPTEKAANDAIVKGDFVVKVFAMPTGKNVGPGAYEAPSKRDLKKGTHNIKGDKQFQGLLKANSNTSPVSSKDHNASTVIDSLHRSAKMDLTKILNESHDSSLAPAKSPKMVAENNKAKRSKEGKEGSTLTAADYSINHGQHGQYRQYSKETIRRRFGGGKFKEQGSIASSASSSKGFQAQS